MFFEHFLPFSSSESSSSFKFKFNIKINPTICPFVYFCRALVPSCSLRKGCSASGGTASSWCILKAN